MHSEYQNVGFFSEMMPELLRHRTYEREIENAET